MGKERQAPSAIMKRGEVGEAMTQYWKILEQCNVPQTDIQRQVMRLNTSPRGKVEGFVGLVTKLSPMLLGK